MSDTLLSRGIDAVPWTLLLDKEGFFVFSCHNKDVIYHVLSGMQ